MYRHALDGAELLANALVKVNVGVALDASGRDVPVPLILERDGGAAQAGDLRARLAGDASALAPLVCIDRVLAHDSRVILAAMLCGIDRARLEARRRRDGKGEKGSEEAKLEEHLG